MVGLVIAVLVMCKKLGHGGGGRGGLYVRTRDEDDNLLQGREIEVSRFLSRTPDWRAYLLPRSQYLWPWENVEYSLHVEGDLVESMGGRRRLQHQRLDKVPLQRRHACLNVKDYQPEEYMLIQSFSVLQNSYHADSVIMS